MQTPARSWLEAQKLKIHSLFINGIFTSLFAEPCLKNIASSSINKGAVMAQGVASINILLEKFG
jgi:hypothetical protein